MATTASIFGTCRTISSVCRSKFSCKFAETFRAPPSWRYVPSAGVANFKPPIEYGEIEFPANRRKLKFIERVPQMPTDRRPPKMTKRLSDMRGPEEIHNKLIHGQFAIVATQGGKMRWGHFEMVRLGIGRKMDESRMFAVWRIDQPWKPITKKGQGHRMGGGKGAIDHYVTPIKADRVIVEMGGYCEFEEVRGILEIVAHKLPFNAKVVTAESLEADIAAEKYTEDNNQNPFTYKYCAQNNILGCQKWMSPVDKKWGGKYW